jgi:hypothetical protein
MVFAANEILIEIGAPVTWEKLMGAVDSQFVNRVSPTLTDGYAARWHAERAAFSALVAGLNCMAVLSRRNGEPVAVDRFDAWCEAVGKRLFRYAPITGA